MLHKSKGYIIYKKINSVNYLINIKGKVSK